MKNLFIAVEYEVNVMTMTLPDSSAHLTRTLKLYSIKLPSGLYNEATLVFDSQMKRPGTEIPLAQVDYQEVQPGVHHINAKLPLAEFEAYYNLVRREAPIGVGFEEQTAGSFTYRFIRLTTVKEPTGEGDAERPARRAG